MIVAAVVLVVLLGAAVAAWVWLPGWKPALVMRHSPWVDPLLRAEAAWHPGYVGRSWEFRQRITDMGPAALPGLRRGADHGDSPVRLAAIGGMRILLDNGHEDPASLALLRVSALEDASFDVRKTALDALVENGRRDESPVVMRAIADPAAEMRTLAAEAMTWHPHDEHLPLLVRAASDPSSTVRRAAIHALAGHQVLPAEDALMRALDDPSPGAAGAAAYHLIRRVGVAQDRRRMVLERLAAALHDDAVSGNACGALDALEGIQADDVAAALRALLDDPDHQARQLAAHLLRSRWVAATPALIRVSIEGLAKDGFPLAPRGSYTPVRNASSSLNWLARQRDADDALLDTLSTSNDTQQRFCCAFLLALHRRSDLTDHIAPVLIPHLQDNHIERDAAWAMRGLFVLGPPVEPWLERALPWADAQGKKLIDQILKNLRHPPTDDAAARRDSPVWKLFSHAQDPSWQDAYEKCLWLSDEDDWDRP